MANTVALTAGMSDTGGTFSGAGPHVLSPGTIPSGRLIVLFLSVASGEEPVPASAHGTWHLAGYKSPAPPTTGRSIAMWVCINTTGSAQTITVTLNNSGVLSWQCSYNAAGYTYIRQVFSVTHDSSTTRGGTGGASTTAQCNIVMAPIGPLIFCLTINGTATDANLSVDSPYSEIGVYETTGSVTPLGILNAADDVGDSSPSFTWTADGNLHWLMVGAEFSNSSITVAQVSYRSVHALDGAASGASVTTRSCRIPADSVVVVTAGVLDTANGAPSAVTISDSSSASWTQVVAGGIVSANTNSRTHAWWSYFASAITITVTAAGATPGDRWMIGVVSYLGGHPTAPISEAASATSTSSPTITLASLAVGNLATACVSKDTGSTNAVDSSDDELGDVGSGGAGELAHAIADGGSAVISWAGFGGQAGTIIGWELALGAQVFPAQVAAAGVGVPGARMQQRRWALRNI